MGKGWPVVQGMRGRWSLQVSLLAAWDNVLSEGKAWGDQEEDGNDCVAGDDEYKGSAWVAASEHTGEFTHKNKDKLGALISQRMLRFEDHKASTTANENLLSLTATEPL